MPQLLTNTKKTNDEFEVMEQIPMISYTLSVMNIFLFIANCLISAIESIVCIMDGLLCLLSESISVVQSRSKNDE